MSDSKNKQETTAPGIGVDAVVRDFLDLDTTVEIVKEIVQILKYHNISELAAKRVLMIAYQSEEITD